MEDNNAIFPQASLEAIIEKMKKGARAFPSLQDYAIHLMKILDKNNDGFVEINEFSSALQTMNIFCTKHEEHALLRRFDMNGDGKVSMEEFYNTL
jgi:Ca2+-binding EF-hand superfamily protein